MKCPKCDAENTQDSQFCKKCAASLTGAEEAKPSFTKTLKTPTEEFVRGTLFADRYEIIEELGTGGMGKVYRVDDKKVGQEIALKLIKPEIASDGKTIERFRNELKTARMISHRNVCRMFDLGEEKEQNYITMEYVMGEDLKSLISRIGQMSIGKALDIGSQLCGGLAEAHRLGIVHRDLKPGNIMIDKAGNAKIMDFGIARSGDTSKVTGTGVIIGTPEYMSPEQAEAEDIDPRSDIYSLGIILYEMITGQVPFTGRSGLSVAMKQKEELPKNPQEINPQIPDELGKLILKCLEKDREHRYETAEELKKAVDELVRLLPFTQTKISRKKADTSREVTVTFSPRKLLIPALAVAALVIAAVMVLWQPWSQKASVIAPKIENSIAVISFENQTGNKSYDYMQKAIPNLLITTLEQSGGFYVITWERMRDLLKQIGEDDVEIIDPDLGFKLCRMEGIESIVLGSFIKGGDTFATDVKVLDVETKKLIKSSKASGKGEDSILEIQIDELSRDILQGMGIGREKIEATQLRVADVTTTSLEAYNYYLRGLQADEKLYHDEARQFFEKAIAIDPDFATAHFRLAFQNLLLGNTKDMNVAFAKAMALSDKASKKERLYIEAAYSSFVEGNSEKGERSLKLLIKEFPKEKNAHYWLAVFYDLSNLSDQAIEEYNKALELDPDYKDALNMIAYSYVNKRDFEKALEYFTRYASLMPGDANPIDSIAELYLHMGRLDESMSKYKEALEIKPDFGSQFPIAYIYALKENYVETRKWINQSIDIAPSPGIKADGYLWKGFYHYWLGNLEVSLEDIRNAVAMADSVGNVRGKARADWLLGWIYYDRGMFELSQQYIKKWFDVYVLDRPIYKPDYAGEYYFLLGLIDLKAGKVNDAKHRLAELEPLINQVQPENEEIIKFYFNYLAAEIFLAEGLLEKASDACEETEPMRFPAWVSKLDPLIHNMPFMNDALARIYQANGELDKAIAEYERLITFDPESKERRLVHPKHHYRLAKLYEEKGWEGKAIEHYKKFLELWKDADPGLPEVEDAKKRLAGLK